MLISSGLAMLILFGLLFYGMWKYQSDRDQVDFDHRTVNPDVPVEPVIKPDISGAMQREAEYIQQNVPLNPTQPAPQYMPNQPQQPVQQYVPNQPPQPAPQYIPNQPQQPQDAQANQPPTPVTQPPHPLMERSEILDAENPIVEPLHQPVDIDIPERSVPSEAKHDSPYGVRYADDNPGRMLRDKRYRRNRA